jgi:hypothetical protein
MSVTEFQVMMLKECNFETVNGKRAPPAIHKDLRSKVGRILSTLPPRANPPNREPVTAK